MLFFGQFSPFFFPVFNSQTFDRFIVLFDSFFSAARFSLASLGYCVSGEFGQSRKKKINSSVDKIVFIVVYA